jgi:hypothetical protein
MSWRATRFAPPQPGPRHSPGWYDQRDEDVALAEGDRLFVPCHGGPSVSRAEVFPPRLEIAEPDGTYVLVDVGPRADWHYEFVPRAP